jgi:hypothetical protein
MQLTLCYDLRSAEFGAPHAELYAAALDHCGWIDALDVDATEVMIMEHHGADDGSCHRL